MIVMIKENVPLIKAWDWNIKAFTVFFKGGWSRKKAQFNKLTLVVSLQEESFVFQSFDACVAEISAYIQLPRMTNSFQMWCLGSLTATFYITCAQHVYVITLFTHLQP